MSTNDSFDTRGVYVISVAAELAWMHPQTLRVYERKGLIDPARTPGKNRRYSERDVQLLRRIQELTNAGVGLAGVQRILELEAQMDAMRNALRTLHAQVEAAQEEVRAAEARVHREYRRDLVPLRQAVVPVRVRPRRPTE